MKRTIHQTRHKKTIWGHEGFPTLRKAECSKHTKLQISVHLSSIYNWVVRPQAQPVVVGQRGGLLECIEEDDGDDESQTDGPEILHIQLQLHLCDQDKAKKRVWMIRC